MFLLAIIVTTSKELVTSSDALVTSSNKKQWRVSFSQGRCPGSARRRPRRTARSPDPRTAWATTRGFGIPIGTAWGPWPEHISTGRGQRAFALAQGPGGTKSGMIRRWGSRFGMSRVVCCCCLFKCKGSCLPCIQGLYFWELLVFRLFWLMVAF